MQTTEAQPRPSWQIDLKWVCGIVACLVVVISSALFSLTEITERGRAVPLATALIAAGVNDRTTDEEFAQLQAAAAADPAASVSLSSLDVEVDGSQVIGLTKEETAFLFAGEPATVLYDEGETAAKALFLTPVPGPDGEAKEPISLGPAGALSAGRHSTFMKLFLASALAVVALLGLLVYLSRGFGRLGSPAVVLALGTTPFVALWALAGNAIGTGDDEESVIAQVARSVARDTAADLRGMFLSLLTVACISVALAFLANLLMPLARKIDQRNAPTESLTTSDPLV